MEPEATIHCIDCGGTCHLITPPPEEGEWQPGDLAVYRCEDCNDRWDMLLPDEDDQRGDSWEPSGF